jgi:malonyl CoA-acyl carrier protein transacylase
MSDTQPIHRLGVIGDIHADDPAVPMVLGNREGHIAVAGPQIQIEALRLDRQIGD